MKILFLGAPGCGKGTQSKKIIKKYNIPQISTGDLLREEIKSGSAIGEEIKNILDVFKNETNSLLSRMTGSGSTCFALFKNKKDLGNAERIFRNKFKNFWVKKTKIVNSFDTL